MDQNKIALAKQEKWFRGDISWKLHSAQKIINQTYNSSKGQLFVGNCSRQFGKTYWAVTKAIEVALRIPNAQIRYGAAFQSDLMDFIIPAFDKALEDCPDSIKGKYKSSGTSFHFPNGSRIKLVGLDKNPNGLRGNTLDLIIIDECGFVTNLDYLYKSVIIPATTHRPNCKIILISTPPSTPAHAFIDYAQKAEAENAYSVFNLFQNPLLVPVTIARLMRETGCSIPNNEDAVQVIESIIKNGIIAFPDTWTITTTFRREYLCEFVTDSDLAIVPEWQDKYVVEIPRDQYYDYYHKYIGLDLGVKDNTAAIFGYYDFKRASLVIEDEFHTNGSQLNTEILANSIKTKEKELWGEKPPFRRISDNNWPLIIQDFSSIHNLTFVSTDKDTLEAMINELRIMVQNGQILINPKCKMLIGCIKYGVWDKNKKKFAKSTTYGHFDHLAALIYLIRNLAKNTNPIPVDHGFENHKAWLGNIKHNKSHNAKVLSEALIPSQLRNKK